MQNLLFQCAVKAKLIELGTGSNSGGYIDDELPDYVMIMVANKRSKKQMRDDLQLFLNENTDSFVNWLHQVLDKLQAVTLPPASKQLIAISTHSPSSSSDLLLVSQKVSGKPSVATAAKEKKSKKQKRSQKDQSPPVVAKSAPASITDVFADQLIGKAKRSLEIEAQTTVKKKPTESAAAEHINIPDLVKTAVVNSKRKELEELEQIQRQIDEAKRQLKIIPDDAPIPEKSKSPQDLQPEEDDDFLNLKADELEEEENQQSANKNELTVTESPTSAVEVSAGSRRNRSPIVFNNNSNFRERRHRETSTKERPPTATGENIISLSAHRQMERELYTPVHRRESGSNHADSHEMSRPRERSRLSESRDRFRRSDERNHRRSPVRRSPVRRSPVRRSPVRRERSPRETRRPRERQPALAVVAATTARRSRDRSVVVNEPAVKRLSVRQRMGSRVIVAPPKPQFNEEEIDVPVNSVVTIKPRPVVAKNRQANKNLLLRAMAEAQKSMVGTLRQQQQQQTEPAVKKMPTTLKVIELQASIGGGGGIKSRLGGTIGTKRQINAIVSSLDAAVKRQKPNEKIIIEIGPNGDDDDDDEDEDDEDELVLEEDVVQSELEYVPKPVDTCKRSEEADVDMADGEVPETDKTGAADEVESPSSNTQFVVTLDGAFKKAGGGVRKRVEVVENLAKKSPVLELQTAAAPVATSRVSSRNAASALPGVKTTGNERAPRQMVDLRQRVQEKRNGSPGKHLTAVRKRRSPICFREKLSEPVDGNDESKEAKKEESNDVPQRKRIRATDSPSKEDVVAKKSTNGDVEKSKVVVVVGKERRDPKKYDNIPPRKELIEVPSLQ